MIEDYACSEIYRRQIKNLADHMERLVARTVKFPLRDMAVFNSVNSYFGDARNTAYLCCTVIDTARSIEGEDRAINATTTLMMELVRLKNEAGSLVNKETAQDGRMRSEPRGAGRLTWLRN